MKKQMDKKQNKAIQFLKRYKTRIISCIICLVALLVISTSAGTVSHTDVIPESAQKAEQSNHTDNGSKKKNSITANKLETQKNEESIVETLPSNDDLLKQGNEAAADSKTAGNTQSEKKAPQSTNGQSQPNTQQPSDTNKQQTSSSGQTKNSGQQQTPAPPSTPSHSHNFNIPITETRTKQVLVSEERVERVDTGRGKYVCNGCNADITDNLDHSLTCNGGSGYHMEPVYEEKVIPAQYKTESYEETVGYKCACGAKK